MSRGLGRLQRQVVELLRVAGDAGIDLVHLRGTLFGWVPARRGYLVDGAPGRWRPRPRDDKALRRALGALVARGRIVVVDDRGRRRRYAASG